MSFVKAQRNQAKLKLALTGPSGSGKTYSALRLAKGLGGRIAVIDTENKSASLYSDRFDFDVQELEPPYSNEKYLDAIQAAVKAKYDILIIDSLSHQWAGEGGLLNKKEQMDARGGNSFTNWAKMTPEHEKLKAAIVHADIHIIGTMRSKTEYSITQNDKGKAAPQKLGLAPIQRDGMEYEFTTVFDVAMNHECEASKDRTGLFSGIFQITESTGEKFKTWLSSGVPKPPVTPQPNTNAPGSTKSGQSVSEYPVPIELVKYEMRGGRYKGRLIKSINPKEMEDYVPVLVDMQSKLPAVGTDADMIRDAIKSARSYVEFNKSFDTFK